MWEALQSNKLNFEEGGDVTQRKYNYATIRITEYYDAIKDGNTTINCNRFWVVSITNSIGDKTSRRVDSNKEFFDFLKDETHLIVNKRKK